jgi:hypothetical protein
MKTILTLNMFLALTGSLLAQDYSIGWFTIDGGGGTSAGGIYTLSGTAGQPDAGSMSGGIFTLSGGFWGVTSACPPPPPLSIRLTPANTIVISWSSASPGTTLEQTSALQPARWMPVTQAAADDGTTKSVTLTPTGSAFFFRLKKCCSCPN